MLTIAVKISNRVARAWFCVFMGIASRRRHEIATNITFNERFITERKPRKYIYLIIYRKWEMGKVPKVAGTAKEILVVSENSEQGHGDPQINSI